jgi:hypothetical protein
VADGTFTSGSVSEIQEIQDRDSGQEIQDKEIQKEIQDKRFRTDEIQDRRNNPKRFKRFREIQDRRNNPKCMSGA